MCDKLTDIIEEDEDDTTDYNTMEWNELIELFKTWDNDKQEEVFDTLNEDTQVYVIKQMLENDVVDPGDKHGVWEQIEEIVKFLMDKRDYTLDDFRGLSAMSMFTEYEDVTDTTWAHPNESEDEFMEHEDW
jgi:hypothetical protein